MQPPARRAHLYLLTTSRSTCEFSTSLGEGGARPRSEFDRLLLEHEQALLARALRRDPNDARDLVHDTFERAMLSLREPWPTNVRAWLYRILDNLFIDRCRRLKARPRPVPIEDVHLVAEPPDTPPPWSRLSSSDVLAASRELPEKLRAVFELHAFAGKKYREIAELLDIPEDTVASRLSRARAQLKTLLSARIAPGRGDE